MNDLELYTVNLESLPTGEILNQDIYFKLGRVWSLDREAPLQKEMATPVFLPGKSIAQKSLAGYSAWDRKELDST